MKRSLPLTGITTNPWPRKAAIRALPLPALNDVKRIVTRRTPMRSSGSTRLPGTSGQCSMAFLIREMS